MRPPITVTIDPQQNRIDGLEPTVPPRIKRLALFLALLLQAKGGLVDFGTLEKACLAQDPDTQISRTIIKRLLDGLEELLGHKQLSRWRLVYDFRNRTVGPWKLRTRKGLNWQVVTDTAPVDLTDHVLLAVRIAQAGHRGVQGDDWGQVLDLVSRFMQALNVAQLGFFDDAVAALDGLLGCAYLSEEFRLWVVLQRADFLRRTNRFANEVDAVLNTARQQMPSLPNTLQAFMQAYAQTVQVWLDYQRDPKNPKGLDSSESVLEYVETAPNPELISRRCQVRGFWLRRRLDALVGASGGSPVESAEAVAVLREAMQVHEAALFWAVLSRDAFWVQTVLVNWILLMQRPFPLQVFAQARTFILQGWTLVYVLDDRFNLFDNTYVAEIHLADFWLSDAAFRQLAKDAEHNYFNDDFGSPDKLRYYTNLLESTRRVNDPDQIKAAEAVCHRFKEFQVEQGVRGEG